MSATVASIPISRRKEILVKGLLLLGGTLVALSILEGFLRLYNPVGIRLRGDRLLLPQNVRQVIANNWNPKLDQQIVFSKNGIGLRGPEPPRDFDAHLTLIAVGGSTTECLYLSDGTDWPGALDERLRPSFPRLWVDNAGIDGHSTYGHIALLEQVLLRIRPKVLVFLIGLNDVGRDLPRARERARDDVPLRERLARHSAILANLLELKRSSAAEARNLGHRQLDLAATPMIAGHRPHAQALVAWNRERCLPGYRERLESLVDLCRRNGIEPVFMTQPALYGAERDDVTGVNLWWIQVDAEQQIHGGLAWRLLEEYNDVTRAVGLEQRVLVVDIAHRLPKSSRFFYDFVHFTREGAAEVAALAAVDLCPFLARRYPAQVGAACSP